MNYTKIKWADPASGPGVRISIYVSGCTHNCKGCFNPETHDFNAGEVWTKELEDKIIKRVNDTNMSGINMLGGDPLLQNKDLTLVNFLKRFKKETGKNIWLWTGFTFEDIINTDSITKKILEQADVCVDGKYIANLYNRKLRYMGSSNQRVIDVNKSIKENKTVLYEES